MTPGETSGSDLPLAALWTDGPVGAFIADADGNWLEVNERWLTITGLTREQALDDGLLDLVVPEDRDKFDRRVFTDDGEPTRLDFSIEHPQLGVRHLHERVKAMSSHEGFMGTLSDVTDRRQAEAALRNSEALHRLTIASIPGSSVGLYDLDLRCMSLTGLANRGLVPQRYVGKVLGDFTSPEVAAVLVPAAKRALRGEKTTGEFTIDGHIRIFTAAPVLSDDGEPAGVVIVGVDVTEQRRVEAERRRADEKFRVAFDRAPIGMAMIGLDGAFLRVNAELQQMLGRGEDELSAGSAIDLVHTDDRPMAEMGFAQARERGETTLEFRMLNADGSTIWVEARGTLVTEETGTPDHLLVQMLDVTERRKLISRLEHLAVHDSLTGLLNRRGFERALAAQISGGRRYGEAGSLLMIDLDRFKAVNDMLGHAGGDDLITACGKALRDRLRETDVIARLGGDEFAVILPAQGIEEAELVALDLVDTIAVTSARFADPAPEVTASIGVTSLAEPTMTPDVAMQRADRAMYSAKNLGRNCVHVYDSGTRGGLPATKQPTSSVPTST